jgi:ubiquitin C-terminal hydrolase
MKKNGKVCTMIVHEAIDNVRSTNQVLHYSSPKTSEDANEFLMILQQFLLHELQNSEEHPGHTTNNQVYDDNLYSSMKDFWNLFVGEIRHEYTCTSCKSSSQTLEPTDYLLLKFPDEFHESNHNCTVESLIEFMLQDEQVNLTCTVCGNTSAIETQKITKYPYFMCIILCRNTFVKDRAGHISSAVQFPALGFDIRGDNMPYDLFASVHRHPRKSGSGHFTAICRSKNLESNQWIEYDDHEVYTSKFTNMKKPGTVLTSRMKTAYIMYYISPSFETRIKNARTINLMDVEERQTQLALPDGVEHSADYADGEEGNADGYEGNSNIHNDGEDDSKDGEEEGREIGEKEASGGDESSSSYETSSGEGSYSK